MEYLLEFAREAVIAYSIGLPRIIGAMSVMSFMSSQMMGGMIARNGVAACLALGIYPMVANELQSVELTTFFIIGISVKELFLGMLIGYLVTVVFWAIQAVGFFIDNQRGAAIASSFNPLIGEQSSPLGLFMTQTLVTLFFVTGLFLIFLEGIYASYMMWPVTSFFPSLNAELIDFFVAQFVLVTTLAVVIGAPVVITMFLAEFGLGLIGRFAPQLNVFFLSMPIKSAVANLILIIFWATLILYFGDLLRDVGEHVDYLDSILNVK